MGESEYVTAIAHGRHMFAWTLVRYGGVSAQEAESQALEFYRYEPPEMRDLMVFHDEPWHWAMLGIAPFYWQASPELAKATGEYREEELRFRLST